jgi:dimeric dUTPase (all-alpha-NTP-PPase superfamily)
MKYWGYMVQGDTKKAQILIMLELQDSMNTKVNQQWRLQNFEWYRAIWVECAELMDHYGWKWWKKQQPDFEQVQLELIDIWHFGLSDLLNATSDSDELAENLARALAEKHMAADFHVTLEIFVQKTLEQRAFDLSAFIRLLAAAELDFPALYRGYIGKNVLNFFRQDNGYLKGSYSKVWNGREDNEHLVELMVQLDSNSPTFKSDLYNALSERYQIIQDTDFSVP